VTWNLSCDRCGADQRHDIRGQSSPSYPRGWQLGAFIHTINGQDYREPSDFCDDCVQKYGTEMRWPWPPTSAGGASSEATNG
jgi:hypothetical protein